MKPHSWWQPTDHTVYDFDYLNPVYSIAGQIAEIDHLQAIAIYIFEKCCAYNYSTYMPKVSDLVDFTDTSFTNTTNIIRPILWCLMF